MEAKAAEQQSDLILAKVCFKGAVLAWSGILVGFRASIQTFSYHFGHVCCPPFFACVSPGVASIDNLFSCFSSYLRAGPLSFACLFWAGSENFGSQSPCQKLLSEIPKWLGPAMHRGKTATPK